MEKKKENIQLLAVQRMEKREIGKHLKVSCCCDSSHFPLPVAEEPGLEKRMLGVLRVILLTPPLN